MSQVLTIELPDETYQAVERAARAAGQTPAAWIANSVSQSLPKLDGASARAQIPDDIYQILEMIAPQEGVTIDELAVYWVERYGPKPPPQLTPEEWEAAEAQLRRFAGAASLGYATGADNESIDADLAREYGSTHEEEG